MSRIVVVGSGASGVHFALSVLRKGHSVTMVDVGHRAPAPVEPALGFNELKERLDDPVRHFLGANLEGITYPGIDGEYYGIPPTKSYIFAGVRGGRLRTKGFEPLASFAQGGLAETWTAGSYPLNDAELADFPFGYDELAPHYGEVASRIGIGGADDDLARFFPVHEHLDAPLDLDAQSEAMLERYATRRERLNGTLGCFLGRSRVATLRAGRGDRGGCSRCGRCLLGCPTGALYTPSMTLRDCFAFDGFRYVGDSWVSHFTVDARRRVTGVVAEPSSGGNPVQIPLDSLVLAAGTLSTSRIYLESVHRAIGESVTLDGLMDNRQILVPYLNLSMLGSAYQPSSYQYHQVAMGIAGDTPREYVHAQITTLKTASIHPIVQRLPFDLRTSGRVFRNIRAALGVLNINLHDTRRPENIVALDRSAAGLPPALRIEYTPPASEPAAIDRAVRTVKRALRDLGCVVPPGMVHVRPMGASVHYAGTIPMSRTASLTTATADCRSHEFENLFMVDGTTFPFLPAKNLTFTLMANAVRVADRAF